jgi:LuxR family maltose regulon positive regulatory protein
VLAALPNAGPGLVDVVLPRLVNELAELPEPVVPVLDDVHVLQERTEGWPAGLQLAALSLRERTDRHTFIRSLAGDDRQIGDYLHDVIEGAERPVREFLLRTAILERMCGPLCEAVTGDPGAAALLAEAFRSNLYVVALDERGHWYRYHHLLRDLLLSQRSPPAASTAPPS